MLYFNFATTPQWRNYIIKNAANIHPFNENNIAVIQLLINMQYCPRINIFHYLIVLIAQ
ncbi:hypothetical protein HMPREF9997_02463 [Corynebacterium durum F0235]|uniref:Uncharacterized protein n=1 Tax=Corynebacterium durum F0235 TaxID=1035195 RepID=L1MAS0_9CORY|nr:hypothetical protein HMPREF9997_02463 [Corynebacterium durum F0235]